MKTHLKQLLVALFATILVCSTIIGIGCYSHAKNDASLLTKTSVEAMSDGEGNWLNPLEWQGINIVGDVAFLFRWVISGGQSVYEEVAWLFGDDAQMDCVWKQGLCCTKNNLSFRTLCTKNATIQMKKDAFSLFHDYNDDFCNAIKDNSPVE